MLDPLGPRHCKPWHMAVAWAVVFYWSQALPHSTALCQRGPGKRMELVQPPVCQHMAASNLLIFPLMGR